MEREALYLCLLRRATWGRRPCWWRGRHSTSVCSLELHEEDDLADGEGGTLPVCSVEPHEEDDLADGHHNDGERGPVCVHQICDGGPCSQLSTKLWTVSTPVPYTLLFNISTVLNCLQTTSGQFCKFFFLCTALILSLRNIFLEANQRNCTERDRNCKKVTSKESSCYIRVPGD